MRHARAMAQLWLIALLATLAVPVAAQSPATPPRALSPETAAKIADLDRRQQGAPLGEQAAFSAKTLDLIAADVGEVSADYLSKLVVHAYNLGWAGKSPEQLRALEKAIAISGKLYGPDGYSTADIERQYSDSLRANGFVAESAAPYARYVRAATEDIYECGRWRDTPAGRIAMGCARDENHLGDTLARYGQLLHELGRGDEGVAAFDAVLARFEPRWAGCETETWATRCDRAADSRRAMRAHYAGLLMLVGKVDRALALRKAIYDETLATVTGCTGDKCEGPDSALVFRYYDYRASLVRMERPAEAQALDEQMLPMLVASPSYARGNAGSTEYSDETMVRHVDAIAETYAKAAIAAAQPDRARAFFARLGLPDLVAAHDGAANRKEQLAALDKAYYAIDFRDGPERAAVLRQKAVIVRAEYGDKSAELANVLLAIARDLDGEPKDAAAADAAYRDALAASRAAKGDADHATWTVMESYTEWLIKSDRRADAIALTRTLLAAPGNDMTGFYADPARAATLASGLSSLFDPHGPLNTLHADLAEWLLASGGDATEALVHARHAAVGKRAYRRAFGFSKSDESGFADATDDQSLFNQYDRPYAGYQSLYADTLWAAGKRDDATVADVFQALQEAQMGTTSRAVAKAAAERVLAQAGMAGLLAERRAIDVALAKLEAENNAIDHPDPAERQRLISENISAQQRLNFKRDGLDASIRTGAPGYFELVRPQPLSVDQARALLAPDEALLMIVPTRFGTHSLLVTHDSINWHRSDLTEAALNGHVRRLLWDVGAKIDVTPDEDERWSLEGTGDFPFDRTTAWTLYQQIVAPFAARLAGKRHLFTASTGSISSLPLGILVTAAPTGADGDPKILRETRWFADQHALLQLPSLQSLQLLRAVGGRFATDKGTAMIGFGDPVLDGAAETRGVGGRVRGTRSGAGLSVAASLQSATGDGPALADTNALRALARLPGTETELKAMQALLGTGQARLYLAGAATETNMKRSKLTGLSVLFLATHGLVAGEVSGLAEPGLVFTPPRNASADDDGLLTASEVASLRLGARWVILSACNTAAGDGSQGAPGLSGLARSFFFAGAESLLASHWPVRDDVAAMLTVRLFELMRANPKLSRAEALQAAMRDIRDDPRADDSLNSWSHPSAWAPFSLIGDGIG